MLIFEPTPGREPRVDELLRAARTRAESAGWRCWAYRDEIHPDEITLFLEGAAPELPGDGPGPIFGDEISELRSLSRRFEPVRSLVELPLEEER